MLFKNISILFLLAITLLTYTSCTDDDTPEPEVMVDFSGSYTLSDQVGRPAINTVFVSPDRKDEFNTTIPSDMVSNFGSAFNDRLLALNPGYTVNALGLDASTFTGVLAADVLGVSTTGTTTFFDGTNVLTGRTLSDDVIDVELLLIFGGSTGADNTQLTSDNVDSNDKAFNTAFPYLANPW